LAGATAVPDPIREPSNDNERQEDEQSPNDNGRQGPDPTVDQAL
jgi:hypothetical protein